MKKLLSRLVLAVVVLVVLGVVLAFYFLDSIVKKGVETVGPMLTQTEVRLDAVNLSPLSGSGSIKGLVIGNPQGFKTEAAIKVGSATLGLRPASVLSDKIHVTRIDVQSPEINYEGTLKNSNLSKILENLEAAAGSSTNATAPGNEGASQKVQVDEFVVNGAKVTLNLNLLTGPPVVVTLPEIRLTGLGQGPDGITVADLTRKMMKELTDAALNAATKKLADLGNVGAEALKEASKSATGNLDEATKGLSDFLKKK